MQSLRILSVEPTVFFTRAAGDVLRQRVRLAVDSEAGRADVALAMRAGGLAERLPLPPLSAGVNALEVDLPDLRAPVPLQLGLLAGGTLRDEKTFDWQPTRHWEVHLMHYAHHDLGYTDLPVDVWREHAAILDDVVRYCDDTADWPDESQFRFVAEQAWSLVSYLESRPPAAVDRLVDAIRRGQIEVTALFANQITELCGTEELIRLLYPSFALKRRYGIDIAAAEHNDIPGFAWGLAGVLAGAGVRYFSPGIPRWYHRDVHQLWDEQAVLSLDRPGAFWWQAADGARVLVWLKSHGSDEWLPTSYEGALRDLPDMLAGLEAQGYACDLVSYMLRGGWRDNAPAVPTYAAIARRWNECWAYPRLVNSTYGRFLSRFEARWGGALKTLRGEAPGTDYPLAATCTPLETGVNRQAHDWLLSAEKWAALASLATDYAYPRAALDEAWRNALCFDEHCWGMANPGGPAQDACASEKTTFAYRAAALAHDVLLKAANRIADAVSYPDDAVCLTVFNPFSWQRTDVVRAPLRPWSPRGMPMHWQAPHRPGDGPIQVAADAIGRSMFAPPASLLEQPFQLIDEATGAPVAYQLSRATDARAPRPWAAERAAMGKVDARYQLELVFVAEDVPPVGYKTYRVVPCPEWPDFAGGATAAAQAVDNRFFRLELDPRTGAVTALIDKACGRDLVDRGARHGFAQVLARRCETAEEEGAAIASVALAETGPLFSTLRLAGRVEGCPSLTQDITLYHTLNRAEVALRLVRDSTPNLELACAFPFLVEQPRFRYESCAAVVEPLRDQLPGSNTDYYAVQHWVEVSNARHGVVWSSVDAPMASFGGWWPGYLSGAHHGVTPPGYGHPFLKPGELAHGHLYSLLMTHNYRTNFLNARAGESLFRFAFTARGPAAGPQPVSAGAFGWGAADPLLGVWMKGPPAGGTPAGGTPASGTPAGLATSASFCRIDTPNVMLLAWKRAEDGDGFILRLIETEGRETEATVTLPALRIGRAWRADLVESGQAPLPHEARAVRLRLGPFAIATVRVAPA
jgi:hypothetical protein